jgi:hypothetical protein
MKDKLAKIIRVLTVAPIMALVMLLILYIKEPALFGGAANFILGIMFLTVLPLLAYPLQPVVKGYKDKGREGQRSLAIIFAVAGYVLGCLSAIVLGAPINVFVIYLSYLLSGALVLVTNKVFHYKASGHACGIAGPSILLVYFGQPCGYIGIAVLLIAWLSSLYMKRHTTLQFVVGQTIPFVALGIVILIKLAI